MYSLSLLQSVLILKKMLTHVLDFSLLCFEKQYRVVRFHLRNLLQSQKRYMLLIALG